MERTKCDYLKVEWVHSFPDEPTLIYAEIDKDRWEVRKIEVFANGRIFFADGKSSTGDTRLGDARTPSLEKIADDRQFKPETITAEEFERLWELAIRR